MTILSRIVRFLFWLLVVSWSVWLLRRAFGWNQQNATSTAQQSNDASVQEPSGTSRRLVRDPVCGMHLDEALAIPLRQGNELLHFCSVACRDAYAGTAKKSAANG